MPKAITVPSSFLERICGSREEDIRDALEVLQRASVLVLQNEIPDAANVLAAEAAKRQGARVVFNAAPTRPLDPLLAQNVDILVVNAVEAEMMCGVAVGSLAAAGEAAAQLSSQIRQCDRHGRWDGPRAG